MSDKQIIEVIADEFGKRDGRIQQLESELAAHKQALAKVREALGQLVKPLPPYQGMSQDRILATIRERDRLFAEALAAINAIEKGGK